MEPASFTWPIDYARSRTGSPTASHHQPAFLNQENDTSMLYRERWCSPEYTDTSTICTLCHTIAQSRSLLRVSRLASMPNTPRPAHRTLPYRRATAVSPPKLSPFPLGPCSNELPEEGQAQRPLPKVDFNPKQLLPSSSHLLPSI